MSEQTWLFIGDSITDCGRKADQTEGIGNGYVRLVRDYVYAKDPSNAPTIINRGISGHKVTDLENRWTSDVLDLSPDLLSIKIGINDVWHNLRPDPAGVPVDQFESVYRDLLKQTRDKLPETRIVLCEPSVIWEPAPAQGNEILQDYIKVVHSLAQEFSLGTAVPLHNAFEKAKEQAPHLSWAPDGVHPSSFGHMLIARTWLKTLDLL